MIRVKLAEKERWLAKRKAELGIEGRQYVAVNSGTRRTRSKRRLLLTIEQEAHSRDEAPRFKALTG